MPFTISIRTLGKISWKARKAGAGQMPFGPLGRWSWLSQLEGIKVRALQGVSTDILEDPRTALHKWLEKENTPPHGEYELL